MKFSNVALSRSWTCPVFIKTQLARMIPSMNVGGDISADGSNPATIVFVLARLESMATADLHLVVPKINAEIPTLLQRIEEHVGQDCMHATKVAQLDAARQPSDECLSELAGSLARVQERETYFQKLQGSVPSLCRIQFLGAFAAAVAELVSEASFGRGAPARRGRGTGRRAAAMRVKRRRSAAAGASGRAAAPGGRAGTVGAPGTRLQ